MKKALLVAIDRYPDEMVRYYAEELGNLALSLNIKTVRTFSQPARATTPAYKVGEGKLDEILRATREDAPDYIIFNEELTNSQIRNLEDVLDTAVIDRTLLILEIFAKRAKTKEAMLQVEIAQLKYLKPRLSAMRNSLEQQQGGIGSRGPGEKKLELDRRRIERDIRNAETALKNIVRTRQNNRRKRRRSLVKNVAVVGYTNTGKSTLLNTLLQHSKNGREEKSAHVEDRLFATLETSTRLIRFKDKKRFTLTDTIGFISNLPHELVNSFKATLEEIKEADLLLHVVDFSHPYYLDQIQTTEGVLKELGADGIETLYVFNKIDLANNILPPAYNPAVKVSLRENQNIDTLIEKINDILFRDDTVKVYAIPQSRGDVVHTLNEHAEILEERYDNDSIRVKARVSGPLREHLRHYEI